MRAALQRAVAPIHRRVALMIGRGLVKLVDDAGGLQQLQVTLLDGEVHDGVERFQDYGISSCPHPGAEHAFASVGGLRTAGIVLAVADRRYRLKVAEGEVALYDDLGQSVWLKRAGVEITSPLKVTVTAPQVLVVSDDVELGAASGGKKVVLDGDAVTGGHVVASSTKVKAT